MKAKFKGLGGVKGLMLLHGEKILIGVAGLAAAATVFFAFKTERLPDKYEPDKLLTQVRNTKAGIESTANNWPKVVRGEHPNQVRVADQIEKREVTKVPIPDYQTDGYNTPVVKPTSPRTDPVLLAASDPHSPAPVCSPSTTRKH